MIPKSKEINANAINLDNIRLDSADTFSFELELPDFNGILSEMQENKNTLKMLDSKEKQIVCNPNVQVNMVIAKMNLIKNLQALAIKDKISVKLRNIDDIKLLINSRNLFGINEDYKINLDSLSKDDIEFFKLCSDPNKKEITINNINPKELQMNFMVANNVNQVSYKSVNFSKGLFNLIEYSFKKQKPVRLDFKGNSSVILNVNHEGKLSAAFISNDAAMEHILRSSIPNLKNKLDVEGIPYEKIVYREKQDSGKNKGGKR